MFGKLSSKVRTARGFTLVEMLAALVVLGLVSGMVAVGVGTATRTYEKERFVSQADVLAASINTTLSDPFRYLRSGASDYEVVYDSIPVRFSDFGSVLDASSGKLALRGTNAEASGGVKLLNDGIYGNCAVESADLELDASGAVETVKLSLSIASPGRPDLGSRDYEFRIRPLGNVETDLRSMSAAEGSTPTPSEPTPRDEGANKTALTQAIADALACRLDTSKIDLWTVLQMRLVAARALYMMPGASQDAVDAATAALSEAIAAYREAGGEASYPLNRSKLREAISLAEKTQSELDKVKDAEDALRTAIQAADNMYRNYYDHDQAEIDAATTALLEAIEAYRDADDAPEDSGPVAPTMTNMTISISPEASGNKYKVGQSGVRASAKATYSDGTTVTTAAWRSSNSGVVAVDANGNLSFKAAGTASVYAVIDGQERKVDLTVEADQQGGGSGGGDTPATGISYRLEQTNAWDGNKQYNIYFTNNTDSKVDQAKVVLTVKGNVTSIDGNVTGVLDGDKCTITFNNWGNGIEAGVTTSSIYMHITGTGDFSLE